MTTGERLVAISTLTSDTALNHFLNIDTGSGGDIIKRIYGTYNTKYVPSEKSKIKYVLPSKMEVKYISSPSMDIIYIKTEKQFIKYVPSQTIKITYKCKP